jgi:UDP-3-O-[3-hydroxymyristoyl] glucosamine N-acyltransferase
VVGESSEGNANVATIASGVTIGANAKIAPDAMIYDDVEEGGVR